jgi:tetratricopeptide (TPR) repeat protein
MLLLTLALIVIVGFCIRAFFYGWGTDAIVRHAHDLLQSANNGDPNADDLLAACCVECERANSRSPHNVFALKIWGAALWCRARRTSSDAADRLFLQAEQKYIAALEARPDDVRLTSDLMWVLWGRAALHTGPQGADLLERICGECERLLLLRPREPTLLTFWANALECMGNRAPMPAADHLYEGAEQKYSEALAIKPDDRPVMCSLATLLWRRARRRSGEQARALLTRSSQWLDAALASNPGDKRALSARAWVLFSRTRMQPGAETDRLLSEAAAQFAANSDPQLHQAAGLIYWAQGMLEPAKQRLAAAESVEPGSAAYNLACVCAQLGHESECRQWLERSREPGILVSREQMSTEAELAAVRDLPWFRELVA